MPYELDHSRLQPKFDAPSFATTRDLADNEGLIGQERAVRAMRLGLSIKARGYNIFVTGEPGTGRAGFAEEAARRQAALEAAPPDIAYVHNFENPRSPKLLALPAGFGAAFARDIEELVGEAGEELSKVFMSKDFETRKHEVVKLYQTKHDDLLREVAEEAKKVSFGVKTTASGMYFMPIINGELISEDAYEELDEQVKAEIMRNSEGISATASATVRAIKDFEQAVRADVEALEYSVGLFLLGRLFAPVMQKYREQPAAGRHLADIKEHMLENLQDFVRAEADEDESLAAMLPWYQRKGGSDTLSKYRINLVCDNAGRDNAPVIVGHNPTYANLFGETEYDNEYGNLTTDLQKIRPGLVHAANGGYLVLNAADLLSNPYAWETLRRVLATGEAAIEPRPELTTGYTLAGIRPQAVPVSLKVILIGSRDLHELISEYDDRFGKLFKIHAEFDYEIDRDSDSILHTARFIKSFAEREKLRHMDYEAVSLVCRYSSRLAETGRKLTSGLGRLADTITEADAFADGAGSDIITALHVRAVLDEREFRGNLVQTKMSEMLRDDTIMIDTNGAKSGQINALAVYEVSGHLFGKPSRITATTYMGKSGIINIEKEAELSGPIHSKGVLVLSGYLGQTYAQDFPLTLSGRIAFEQTYSGVDGDSASAAEAIAILSSLADCPISQGIAMTGSLDQMGRVQAVGGITPKIEGFFDLCRKRGLTGGQGVIIPRANVADLVLKDSVVEAVKAGAFHIYPVGHIDEALEILTGTEAGRPNGSGRFPPASVHGRAHKKLRGFHKKAQA
ncbi:MAG: AAA family ATPase [Defluviitaleaceae bacterium]|nr:AAA family ATPase [Defluviitaleaceae bacterium]